MYSKKERRKNEFTSQCNHRLFVVLKRQKEDNSNWLSLCVLYLFPSLNLSCCCVNLEMPFVCFYLWFCWVLIWLHLILFVLLRLGFSCRGFWVFSVFEYKWFFMNSACDPTWSEILHTSSKVLCPETFRSIPVLHTGIKFLNCLLSTR